MYVMKITQTLLQRYQRAQRGSTACHMKENHVAKAKQTLE